MKALTIWQPWASLIACGAKRFETRSWATSLRGKIAIHAALRPAHELDRKTSAAIVRAFDDCASIEDLPGYIAKLPHGAVVATAELVGCHKMWDGSSVGLRGAVCIDMPNQYWSPNWQTETDEFILGDWRPGRFAWELRNVKLLPTPVRAKGQQGLWDWDEREGMK